MYLCRNLRYPPLNCRNRIGEGGLHRKGGPSPDGEQPETGHGHQSEHPGERAINRGRERHQRQRRRAGAGRQRTAPGGRAIAGRDFFVKQGETRAGASPAPTLYEARRKPNRRRVEAGLAPPLPLIAQRARPYRRPPVGARSPDRLKSESAGRRLFAARAFNAFNLSRRVIVNNDVGVTLLGLSPDIEDSGQHDNHG